MSNVVHPSVKFVKRRLDTVPAAVTDNSIEGEISKSFITQTKTGFEIGGEEDIIFGVGSKQRKMELRIKYSLVLALLVFVGWAWAEVCTSHV